MSEEFVLVEKTVVYVTKARHIEDDLHLVIQYIDGKISDSYFSKIRDGVIEVSKYFYIQDEFWKQFNGEHYPSNVLYEIENDDLDIYVPAHEAIYLENFSTDQIVLFSRVNGLMYGWKSQSQL